MEAIQNIIIDDTLKRVGDAAFESYLCHAYCHAWHCTFIYNNREFRFEAGDCMIIPRRGDLVKDVKESEDFRVDVIYVTQEFIEIATPQSNYGMRGHLSLFDNPIMHLTEKQQEQCRQNFDNIRHRLADATHHFHHEVLVNAVQTMILDFFDFHASGRGFDKITSQYQQLMEQFLTMLERGDARRNREIGYYADQLCVTPKYLSEVCKKVSGLPANYWITRGSKTE